MPRLVHLARASQRRSIERSGLRGARRPVLNEDKKWVEHRHVIYAMPMTTNFALTYQWVRELGRWHDEKLIAVHLRIPSEEAVLVGRYSEAHVLMPLGEAIPRLLRAPDGNEIVVLRPVRATEIVRVAEVTQRVGWIETPEQHGKSDCLCSYCVPRGSRDLMRRVRAAMDLQFLAARNATKVSEVTQALERVNIPLERAKGRYPVDRLLVFLSAEDPAVRRAAVHALGHFSWRVAAPHFARMLVDDDWLVRERALDAAVQSGGVAKAFSLVASDDERTLTKLADRLGYTSDIEGACRVLEAMAKLDATPSAARLSAMDVAARELLQDQISPAMRARLERI